MKKAGLFIILIVCLGFLFVTNPHEADFVKYLKNSVSVPQSKGNLFEQITGKVLSEAIGVDSQLSMRRENYVFFSIFTYRGPFTKMKPTRYLGILNQFFMLN